MPREYKQTVAIRESREDAPGAWINTRAYRWLLRFYVVRVNALGVGNAHDWLREELFQDNEPTYYGSLVVLWKRTRRQIREAS
jgi:hypothetical protein